MQIWIVISLCNSYVRVSLTKVVQKKAFDIIEKNVIELEDNTTQRCHLKASQKTSKQLSTRSNKSTKNKNKNKTLKEKKVSTRMSWKEKCWWRNQRGPTTLNDEERKGKFTPIVTITMAKKKSETKRKN